VCIFQIVLPVFCLYFNLLPFSSPLPLHSSHQHAAIQKLSLASNQLRGLPDEIAACTTLEELYLSNNAKFSYFPGSAGHLRCVCGRSCCTILHWTVDSDTSRTFSINFLVSISDALPCFYHICNTSFFCERLSLCLQEAEGAVAGQVPRPEAAAQHQ
jgi:Leucine-rich repeat (LRR) protein